MMWLAVTSPLEWSTNSIEPIVQALLLLLSLVTTQTKARG